MFDLKRDKSFLLHCLGLIAVLLGCQGAALPPNQQESHEHFPPHWPNSIFQASDRLAEILQETDATAPPSGISPQQEIMDLVGWLPILAADSDLDRKTFDRIDEASMRIYQRWKALPQPPDLASLTSDTDVREMTAWLSDICQRERPSVQVIEEANPQLE